MIPFRRSLAFWALASLLLVAVACSSGEPPKPAVEQVLRMRMRENPPDTDPGWFFVIKERPGEPRFGLEIDPIANPEVLDELSWPDAVPGIHDSAFLPASALGSVTLTHPPADDPEGKLPQYIDDEKALTAAASSARWAYELFRPPVMVAVHADEMLR